MYLIKSSNVYIERKENAEQARAVAVTSHCDSVHHSGVRYIYMETI